MPIDDQAARIASNQVRFRDINETLADGLRRLPPGSQLLSFVCECGERECAAMVSLSLEEHDAVRADGRHFLVVPGHDFPAAERVIEDAERYAVVEKLEETRPSSS